MFDKIALILVIIGALNWGSRRTRTLNKGLESAQRAFTHANDDGKRFSNTNDVGS